MALTSGALSTMATEGYSYNVGSVVLNGTIVIPVSEVTWEYPSPGVVQMTFPVPNNVTSVTIMEIKSYEGEVLSANNLFTTVVPNTFFKYRITITQKGND